MSHPSSHTGTLYVVATPIGNLQDITLRALEVLRSVDVVYAEDTRVTKKLLRHFDISVSVKGYNAHSQYKHRHIGEHLAAGRTIALVTDAGTPGVSDPGSHLVSFIRSEFPNVVIEPIPGVTAVTTALSVAGTYHHTFCFLGFPPTRKGRSRFFEHAIELTRMDHAVILYESPHRIIKTLEEIEPHNDDGKLSVYLGRELTKQFEQHLYGSPRYVRLQLEAQFQSKQKGEFVLIIERLPAHLAESLL